MLSYLVRPVLEFMHFVQHGTAIVLATSYHIGRAILLLLLKIFHFIRDIFGALIIVGEELYYFLRELNESIGAVSLYVQTSANGGVNCVVESVLVFCRHIGKFFRNTKLHSKLLATNLGHFVCYLFDLLRNALLLIADCTWWLITIVPRGVCHVAIAVGDLIVNSITFVRKAVVYTIAVLIEDIFRLTIAVALLLLLWGNRRRLGLGLLRCCLHVKRASIYCYRRLLVMRIWLFRRSHSNPTLMERTTPSRSRVPRPSVSPALSDKSLDPHLRCVVCRDHQKCVLLLPCKHLCLCEECADYMTFSAQRQTCPLCRTNITHTMSVYT